MASKTQAIVLEVGRREDVGKNACRRMRAAGRVPGNVYGLDAAPFAVAVDPRAVEAILQTGSGRNTIFSLALEGGQDSRSVMLREIQRDPVSQRLLHVDFVRFDPTKKIHVKVPVQLIGTPLGVKNEGGVLDFVHREVEVECLPAQIPEHFDVDVSELHIGQHVSIADLRPPEEVKVLDDAETILAVVAEPRAEIVEAAAPPAEEEVEPEVVGKEEEGEAEEKKDKDKEKEGGK